MSGIQDVAREAGLKPEIVANLFEAILASVSRGEKVRIKGIGTFERKLYKGRTLVTPAVNDGKAIKYPDSYVLKFHQSQLAKRRINIVAKKQADAETKTPKNGKAKHAKAAAAAEAQKPGGKAKSKPHPEDNPVPIKKKKQKPAHAPGEE